MVTQIERICLKEVEPFLLVELLLAELYGSSSLSSSLFKKRLYFFF